LAKRAVSVTNCAQNSPLSELKALAQQAQQQLDNLPALQAGLEALHAEIGKLTA